MKNKYDKIKNFRFKEFAMFYCIDAEFYNKNISPYDANKTFADILHDIGIHDFKIDETWWPDSAWCPVAIIYSHESAALAKMILT